MRNFREYSTLFRHLSSPSPVAREIAALVARLLKASNGMSATELGARWGVSSSYVNKLRDGFRPERMNSGTLDRLRSLVLELEQGATAGHSSGFVYERMVPFQAGWPEGWQARTYRLQLEAAQKDATEEEIAVIRRWMLDPQLQALWSGGAPSDDRMKELDGIEIGARAWLRARGRMVRIK